MNFMGSMDWYQKQEQERQERMKANDCTQLNRQLQQLISRVRHDIDLENVKDVEQSLIREFGVVQSSLWNLSWANNFENERVVLAQGLFLNHLLKTHTFENEMHLRHELDRLMRQLGNIDWSLFGEYNHRCQ